MSTPRRSAPRSTGAPIMAIFMLLLAFREVVRISYRQTVYNRRNTCYTTVNTIDAGWHAVRPGSIEVAIAEGQGGLSTLWPFPVFFPKGGAMYAPADEMSPQDDVLRGHLQME